MSHPPLPLKFRRQSISSNDYDDVLPSASSSSSSYSRYLPYPLASPASTGAYSHDAFALESASSASSSPIAHSIPLPSQPSSPLEYSYSPQIRHNSSPIHGNSYGSSYAHAIRADDWSHTDQNPHHSKHLYGYARYREKLSPVFPHSSRSTFSYSSTSELEDDWEDPPLTSELDNDSQGMHNDYREFIQLGL